MSLAQAQLITASLPLSQGSTGPGWPQTGNLVGPQSRCKPVTLKENQVEATPRSEKTWLQPGLQTRELRRLPGLGWAAPYLQALLVVPDQGSEALSDAVPPQFDLFPVNGELKQLSCTLTIAGSNRNQQNQTQSWESTADFVDLLKRQRQPQPPL